MRRYKSPVSGLKPGVASGLGGRVAAGGPVPALSSPTTAADGQESITSIGVDTTVGSGTLSWGVFDAATTPDKATIIAGTGSPAYGNQTVTATGTQSVSDQIGLSAASDYKTWFVHDGSTVVGTALYWTWPDVLGTGGTLTFSASDNGGDVDLIVYKDASPIYTGTLTQAQYQAEEFLLVAPVISGTAGVGEVLTRDSAALWLWDATSGNSVSAIWQKDGVDITGETGTTYTTVAGDAGADITYKETLGASTSSSNAISIPAAASLQDDARTALVALDSDAAFRTITEAVAQGRLWQDTGGTTAATADGHVVRKIDMMTGTSLVKAGTGDATLRLVTGKYYLEFSNASQTYFDYTNTSGTNTALNAGLGAYVDRTSITWGQRGFLMAFGDSGVTAFSGSEDFTAMTLRYQYLEAGRNAGVRQKEEKQSAEVMFLETHANLLEMYNESLGSHTGGYVFTNPLDFNTIRLGSDTVASPGNALTMHVYGIYWCRASLDATARATVIAGLAPHINY